MSRSSYLTLVSIFLLGLFAMRMHAQDAGGAPSEDSARVTEEVPDVFAVFSLEYAKADEMQRIVGELFIRPVPRQSPFGRAGSWEGGIRTSFDARTNALIVVGPQADLAMIRSLVERLDRPLPAEGHSQGGNTISQPSKVGTSSGTRVRVEASSVKGIPLEVVTVATAGQRVKKGDLLLAINSAPLAAALHAQQIEVEQTRAAMSQIESRLANISLQQEFQAAEAERQFELAKTELREYQEGVRPLELKVHETEVKQAKRQLDVQKRLIEGGKADPISLEVAEAELEVAESTLQVFEKFTAPKMMTQLQGAVDAAKLELQRFRGQTEEETKAVKAALASNRAKLDLEVNKLERLQSDVAKCKILAPHDGIVSTEGLPPIRKGAEVRAGQIVLILTPDG